MTDDEKPAIEDRALGSLARAQKRLAYLQCKAKQAASDISMVGSTEGREGWQPGWCHVPDICCPPWVSA